MQFFATIQITNKSRSFLYLGIKMGDIYEKMKDFFAKYDEIFYEVYANEEKE